MVVFAGGLAVSVDTTVRLTPSLHANTNSSSFATEPFSGFVSCYYLLKMHCLSVCLSFLASALFSLIPFNHSVCLSSHAFEIVRSLLSVIFLACAGLWVLCVFSRTTSSHHIIIVYRSFTCKLCVDDLSIFVRCL